MFGYVKTYTPELYVREDEYYRGIYCGLCRSLGKCTGQLSRMTLNYDFVFGALLRIAATGESVSFKPRRCVVHPVRKRAMAEECESLDFCARAAVLLSYHKNEDDLSDEKGKRRLLAKLLKGLMRGMHRRARKQLREAEDIISSGLASLAEIEKKNIASVDVPADAFGKLMGDLLSVGLRGNEEKIIKNAAFHLGRWIYIVDAADDLEGDAKNGRYNPFLLLYGKECFDDTDRENVFNALSAELMRLSDAVDLLDQTPENAEAFGIIYNVLKLGMPNTAERVLYGEKGKDNERSL